ncbi:MAG: 50S ribosomal protein L30 [Desulfobacterales bacterium]|nr:50S ribosomal protein L30 [Desulfobacterales bacterium]
MLKVTLVKSMIGRPEKQRQVLRGHGADPDATRRVELKDTPGDPGHDPQGVPSRAVKARGDEWHEAA